MSNRLDQAREKLLSPERADVIRVLKANPSMRSGMPHRYGGIVESKPDLIDKAEKQYMKAKGREKDAMFVCIGAAAVVVWFEWFVIAAGAEINLLNFAGFVVCWETVFCGIYLDAARQTRKYQRKLDQLNKDA